LAMVERYSHLSPDHLRAAVERLVPASEQVPGPAQLSRNYPGNVVPDRTHEQNPMQPCETTRTEG